MKSFMLMKYVPAVAFAAVVAASPFVTAQAPKPATPAPAAPAKTGPVEQLTATATIGKTSEAVKIDVLRWSTDAERDQFLAALQKGDKELLAALEKAPTVGYFWTSDPVGHSVKYAYQTTAPEGERIIFIVNPRLGSFNPRLWEAVASKEFDYPFTVIEVRMTKAGGEGKASISAKVAADQAAKAIALENFAAAPVLLKNVKRGAGRTS